MAKKISPKVGVVRRLAIIAPSIQSIMTVRLPFVQAVIERGHQVLVVVPDLDPQSQARLDALGILHAEFEPYDSFLKTLAVLQDFRALSAILVEFAPDTVLCYGGRMLVMGVHAAKRARISHIVAMMNGVPLYLFSDTRPKSEPSGKTLSRALRKSHEVICHNKDDVQHLKELGMIAEEKSVTVIPGAGVDLDHNARVDLPPVEDGLTFLMIAKLELTKGAHTFCQAAKKMKSSAPSASFLLAGPAGRNDDVVGPEHWQGDDSNIQFLGPLEDVRDAISKCHVFVYPSFCEGMPSVVLEAMATGRPIITSDAAGCRDTVDERVNGVLITPGEADELVSAMESFVEQPGLLQSMGLASRRKAERRFSHTDVEQKMLAALRLS